MENDVYAITDINGYALEMREAAAKSIADPFDDNLDTYISLNQMINLIKDECLGFDYKDRPLLNEDVNEKIYESAAIWIHNIGLAKLAAKNLIECAWDSKEKEFIFWASQTTGESPNESTRNSTKNH